MVFSMALGELTLLALSGPSVQDARCDSAELSLLYVTSGAVTLQRDQVHWTARAGSCLLVPGGCLDWQSEACSLVCLMLGWSTVSALLQRFAPEGQAISAALAGRGSPLVISGVSHDLEAALLASLDRMLHLVSQLHSVSPLMLSKLGLADQLTSLVLLLAFPQLCSEELASSGTAQGGGLGAAFDDLIDYIKANLDQALNLTVLERRSHYSRRSLQYAFRERFGCTATQWIRSQRLDLAYRLLRNPDPETSVASIAQACGYRSMSLFSIEFQQRFHRKPSLLLRESRAMDQGPTP